METVMDSKVNCSELGEQVGVASAEATITKVEAYVAHEKRRIELVNQAKLVGLEAEFSYLVADEKELDERLRHTLPAAEFNIRRRKEIYYWCVAAILSIAGFFF